MRIRNNDVDPTILGQRIRQARERIGLSQEEFAARISKDQRAISEYEHGKRRISVTDLPLIARVLDVPILYFFEEEITPRDLDDQILRQFRQLSNRRSQKAALELMRVFVEAINQPDE
jgi:transcriptional regulator with XRE-family HTH domain